MSFGWQTICGAAVLENDPNKKSERLAAAQKAIIQRLQELSGADEGLREVRALREALDSLYAASPQQRFRAGELADEEYPHRSERKWMRVAAGVCAALLVTFAVGWAIQKRTEANELQRLRTIKARAANSTSPSMIAEPLGAPPEVAADPGGDLAANPSSERPAPSPPVAGTAPVRNTNTIDLHETAVNGSAGTSDSPAPATDEVRTPLPTTGNGPSDTAASADQTSAASTDTTPTTVSPSDPREQIQTAPLAAPAEQQSTPSDTAAPQEKSQAADAPAPALAPPQTSAIRQGSVSVDASRYPSIRVPPELKIEAARSGATLQIGEPVSRVEPMYPEDAERQGIQGTVSLRAIVGKDGAVQNVEVVNGPSLLATAAVNAIRQWRYRPTLLGDRAVEVAQDIIVVFRLANTTAAN